MTALVSKCIRILNNPDSNEKDIDERNQLITTIYGFEMNSCEGIVSEYLALGFTETLNLDTYAELVKKWTNENSCLSFNIKKELLLDLDVRLYEKWHFRNFDDCNKKEAFISSYHDFIQVMESAVGKSDTSNFILDPPPLDDDTAFIYALIAARYAELYHASNDDFFFGKSDEYIKAIIIRYGTMVYPYIGGEYPKEKPKFAYYHKDGLPERKVLLLEKREYFYPYDHGMDNEWDGLVRLKERPYSRTLTDKNVRVKALCTMAMGLLSLNDKPLDGIVYLGHVNYMLNIAGKEGVILFRTNLTSTLLASYYGNTTGLIYVEPRFDIVEKVLRPKIQWYFPDAKNPVFLDFVERFEDIKREWNEIDKYKNAYLENDFSYRNLYGHNTGRWKREIQNLTDYFSEVPTLKRMYPEIYVELIEREIFMSLLSEDIKEVRMLRNYHELKNVIVKSFDKDGNLDEDLRQKAGLYIDARILLFKLYAIKTKQKNDPSYKANESKKLERDFLEVFDSFIKVNACDYLEFTPDSSCREQYPLNLNIKKEYDLILSTGRLAYEYCQRSGSSFWGGQDIKGIKSLSDVLDVLLSSESRMLPEDFDYHITLVNFFDYKDIEVLEKYESLVKREIPFHEKSTEQYNRLKTLEYFIQMYIGNSYYYKKDYEKAIEYLGTPITSYLLSKTKKLLDDHTQMISDEFPYMETSNETNNVFLRTIAPDSVYFENWEVGTRWDFDIANLLLNLMKSSFQTGKWETVLYLKAEAIHFFSDDFFEEELMDINTMAMQAQHNLGNYQSVLTSDMNSGLFYGLPLALSMYHKEYIEGEVGEDVIKLISPVSGSYESMLDDGFLEEPDYFGVIDSTYLARFNNSAKVFNHIQSIISYAEGNIEEGDRLYSKANSLRVISDNPNSEGEAMNLINEDRWAERFEFENEVFRSFYKGEGLDKKIISKFSKDNWWTIYKLQLLLYKEKKWGELNEIAPTAIQIYKKVDMPRQIINTHWLRLSSMLNLRGLKNIELGDFLSVLAEMEESISENSVNKNYAYPQILITKGLIQELMSEKEKVFREKEIQRVLVRQLKIKSDSLGLSLKEEECMRIKADSLRDRADRYAESECLLKEEAILAEAKAVFLRNIVIILCLFILMISGGIILLLSKNKTQILSHRKEMTHRIVNNLNSIDSVLYKRIRKSEGVAKSELEKVKKYIESVLSLQGFLNSRKNIHDIDLSFVKKIADKSGEIADVKCSTKIEKGICLGYREAYAVGVIVNEMITNSSKHAFHGVENPLVFVNLFNNGNGTATLEVGDNGNGIPNLDKVLSKSDGRSLGMTLIRQNGKTLDSRKGAVFTNVSEGVMCTIVFKPNKQ